MSTTNEEFYRNLAESYEEILPADPQTVDLLERSARHGASASHASASSTPRVLDAGCGTGAHLSSLTEVSRWIHHAASIVTAGGQLVIQFMDASPLPVGGGIKLPQLTSSRHGQQVSMDRRYLRETSTTLRFDTHLRIPEKGVDHPMSNNLLVLSGDELKQMLSSAGFTGISVISSSLSRTVRATIGSS
ncbi:MAG: hypothetical protein WD492_10055 [Alkalispirochaeta sp.]